MQPRAVTEQITLNKLSFKRLRKVNVARCYSVFHPLRAWTTTDWACALAGEVGEVCNAVKKFRRGDWNKLRAQEEVAKELGDVIVYADLLAARMGIDLGQAVTDKFNEISARRNCKKFKL